MEDILSRVHQSLAPLIDSVIVGQIQVSDAVLSQGVEPFGLTSEDVTLEDGRLNLCGRTLQIANDQLRTTKHGVNTV